MKQGKRWIALMLALAMCLSVLPASVLATELGSEAEVTEVAAPEDSSEAAEVEEPQAAETEEPDEEPVEDVSPSTMAATSGKCGKNVTWKLDSKGTLTISGKGEMAYWYSDDVVPWYKNRKKIVSVVIKNGVTNVGEHAFWNCSKLNSVTLPDSVTSIGYGAFFSCRKLGKITIPQNVTSIGDLAFYSCSNLTKVNIPSKVTYIGEEGIFNFCNKLTSISVESGNKVYASQDGVLYNKEKSILICYPAGIKSSNVIILNGVKEVGSGAFLGCSNITGIDIPDSVTVISDDAFCRCTNLKRIVIPDSITNVGDCAFYGCEKLTQIYFQGTAPDISEGPGYNTMGRWGTFTNLTATAYYPENDPTWTSDKRKNYGGNITWKTWNPNKTGKVVSLTYSSGGKTATDGVVEHDFYFDDAFFYKSNEVYHNDLAVMSLGLELTAFSHPKYDKQYTAMLQNNERAENLKNAYSDLGFYHDEYYYYNTPLSDNSNKVAFSFARKEITNGTDTDTLVAVVLRGGGYGAEWASNFYVENAGNSAGFNDAAERVLKELRKYLLIGNVKGEVKLWIVGYSRAAATANILAHYINKDIQEDGVLDESSRKISSANVYAYTFATPNGYRVADNDGTCDNNIMNVVSDNDLVPRVPLKQWGFSKYGRTYTITTAANQYAAKRFGVLTGQSLTCYNARSKLENLMYNVSKELPGTSEYVPDVQRVIMSALSELYSTNTLKKRNTMDPIQAVVRALQNGNLKTTTKLAAVLSKFLNVLLKDQQAKISHLDIGIAHWPDHYLAWLETGGGRIGEKKKYVDCTESERQTIEDNLRKCFAIYSNSPGVVNNPVFPVTIYAKDIVREYSSKQQIFSVEASCASNGMVHYVSDNDAIQVDRNNNLVVRKGFIGKATITITVDETDIYKKATKTITVTVKKASQPIKVSPAKKSYKALALKKKAKKFNIKVKKAKGKVTCTSNSKSVTVNGKGKVTVSKGIKKGTYKVTVTAAETSTHAKATQTVVIRIT